MNDTTRAGDLIANLRRILADDDLGIDQLKFEIENHLNMDEFMHGPMREWAGIVRRYIYRHKLKEITSSRVRNAILVDCVCYNGMSIQESHAVCDYLQETGHLSRVEDDDEHGFSRRYVTALHHQF